ncbi:hypothetical protein RJ55_08065 [Drechmeria coniospora]|nr:hypothetical protein RJ55_08065 [Drechmeria coniospora]
MDYSASMGEGEDPAGASPWGNSPGTSPQHDRAVFGALAADEHAFPYAPIVSPQTADVAGGFPELGRANTESSTETESVASPTVSPIAAQSARGLPSVSEVSEPAPPAEQPRPVQKPAQAQGKLQVKITGLERTGKRDPVLRFDVHTNLPRFRTTQYRDVRRLHSEFVKLADHLISANPEALVPAVPPPVTAAGAGTDEDETRVKSTMQKWFSHVCSSEVLMKDDEMVLFVESDFGYSPLLKMKQPATGVRRKILKQFAPPPDDTPELSSARPMVKLFYLGTMDASHKVDKMVKSRRGLGLAESDYGVKLGSMHVQEPHPGLANAYRKLGRIIQTMGDYHAAQATAEAASLGDTFQYHSQDAFIVKESLTNRQILIREFLQAQEATRGRLNAADRLKASTSVRREKVDEAIASLDDARQYEQNLYAKTNRVTKNLVLESRKWFTRSAEGLRLSIREYVMREIEAERRALALLETVRPDIRAIDASGGLSRLGREAHPPVRRTNLAASQGPKGDAWSGVPRRSDATGRLSSSVMGQKPDEGDGSDQEAGKGKAGQGGTPDLPGANEDDGDRIDARNAASRLAASTF